MNNDITTLRTTANRWTRLWGLGICFFLGIVSSVPAAESSELDALVGQPVDIAASAYQYRADRPAAENAPESFLALMRYANQPLNQPMDGNASAVRQALCGLLWEEIRPVKTLELTWTADAQRRPAPADLAITTLNNRGGASSWWNNLTAVGQTVTPTVSGDGRDVCLRARERHLRHRGQRRRREERRGV